MSGGLILARSARIRIGALTLFYMAQGVPIGLFSVALPAWLAAEGIGTADIATLVAVTSLPWGFKLIAGPFMDRFSFLPMGRRRPWVMAAQAGLTLSMSSLVLVADPVGSLWTVVSIGFLINSFAAMQDVAVDGMAIDVLPEQERGRANAFMAFGQVAGYSGFGALNGFLLVRYGLPVTALVSAVAVGLVLLAVTLIREREGERLLPWTPGQPSGGMPDTRVGFVHIFRDLLRVLLLPMSLVLVGVEFLGRASAGVAISIFPVISVNELGFGADTYAYWMGILSGLSAVIGLIFGPLVDRFGAKPLLMAGMVSGCLVAAAGALTQPYWGSTPLILSLVTISQLSSQLLFVAVIAAFMGICWSRVAATQFAVYMSLSNLSRSVGAGLFALVASDMTSVQALYLMSVLFLMGALLLSRFDAGAHRQQLGRLETGDPQVANA